ncbi:MAG: cytochrome d ubiquinol oxidase subunit II [Gammaproteobacteria bacterium]|jgi:cytochrome d ubiquinol oxidase subunit II|nr:cytochrome d ubiquinol oxidase subunit II [Gammaproteobacteria bacterium]
MDLNLIWFLLLGALLAGYAILDGFDLGVGILHPLARTDHERRVGINAIGPLWDGNEVWLVTFGGALFAAFPEVYSGVFSGFYTAFMLLLFALIFRAVSLEFRGKVDSPSWKRVWDVGFFGGSLLATLLFGVAVGNAMRGIALDEVGRYHGGIIPMLNPYALLVGLMTVAMFAMHGSIYLFLKSEGEFQQRLKGWMWHTWGVFLVLYVLTTMYTLIEIDRVAADFSHMPWAAAVVLVNVLAVANIPRAVYAGRHGQAFLSSCLTILCLVVLFGLALFPNLVVSSGSPEHSLTIYNAASSEKTLTIMFIIACMGMPFVLAYTAVIYWTFRGKVKLGEHSY